MSLTVKAAIGNGKGGFEFGQIEGGEPHPDEVLVKMKAAGLCHTDHDSLSWGKSIVLGHEGAGVVEKVGADVTAVKPGDKVILNWATPCMTCFQCQEGNQHICENNSPVTAGSNGYTEGHAHLEGTKWKGEPIERSFNIGTISEYTLVKESACVKLESEMPMPSASIVSCGVMTGYGSVVNAAELAAGSSAVTLLVAVGWSFPVPFWMTSLIKPLAVFFALLGGLPTVLGVSGSGSGFGGS